MNITVTKASYSESAKLLQKQLRQQHKKVMSLAVCRDLLAKTLKFDSEHALQQFLSPPENSGADKSTPRKRKTFMSGLEPSEVEYSIRCVMLALASTEGTLNVWAQRGLHLARALCFSKELSDGSWVSKWHVGGLGLDDLLHRFREGRDSAAADASLAELHGYLISLPGINHSHVPHSANAVNTPRANQVSYDQHGYVLMQLEDAMTKIRAIADNADLVVANPHIIRLGREGRALAPWLCDAATIQAFMRMIPLSEYPETLTLGDAFEIALFKPRMGSQRQELRALMAIADLPHRIRLAAAAQFAAM